MIGGKSRAFNRSLQVIYGLRWRRALSKMRELKRRCGRHPREPSADSFGRLFGESVPAGTVGADHGHSNQVLEGSIAVAQQAGNQKMCVKGAAEVLDPGLAVEG